MTETLGAIIVKCLQDKGELGTQEIAAILGVHFKAVNTAIGHLRKRGVVVEGTALTKVMQTPYGPYQSNYSGQCKWKLKI